MTIIRRRESWVQRISSTVVALLLGCLLPYAVAGEAPESIDVEVFRGPTVKKHPTQREAAALDGHHGWVSLAMMIDAQGKPYEISVADSSGNAELDKAALRVAQKFEYEPATRGGVPVDSSFTTKLFSWNSDAIGARAQFIRKYEAINKAIEAGDQALAEQGLAQLEVNDLYEDANKSVSSYLYHARWGTKAEQLADLRRATDGETTPRFLPEKTFRLALVTMLKLQASLNDFGGALATWKILQPLAPQNDLPELQRFIAEINALRNDNRPVRLSGRFGGKSNWNGVLFKPHFQIRIASGNVSEIKLRCEKGYVFFKHQSGLEYTVQAKEGLCNIELVGEPETTFDLVQS
jgi:TonB family protein